jgi:DegV family protein with EDD domain
MKISEFIKKGLEETQIVEKVNEYINGMRTFFMLETLENLVKAGRISPLVAKVTSILNVRPIMAGTEEGTIKVQEKVIGAKKAFRRFVELIGEEGTNLEDRILGIAHCNCLEKAVEFKNEVLKRYNFKDIIIVKTAGISSVYANEGGLIIAF